MSDFCRVVVLIPIEFATALACLSFNQCTPQYLVLQDGAFRNSPGVTGFAICMIQHSDSVSQQGSSLPTGGSSLNSCTWLMCFERTWCQRFEKYLGNFLLLDLVISHMLDCWISVNANIHQSIVCVEDSTLFSMDPQPVA